MSWRDYFIKTSLRKLLVQRKERRVSFMSMNDIRHIMLFYDQTDHEEAMKCVDKLRQMNKRVSVCVFSTQTEEEKINSLQIFVCGKRNINFWYYPSSHFVEQINNVQVDLIIDLTSSSNMTAKYILLQHPCNFKTGFKESEIDWYNFSIVVTDRKDLVQLFEHLLFYLNRIRSK